VYRKIGAVFGLKARKDIKSCKGWRRWMKLHLTYQSLVDPTCKASMRPHSYNSSGWCINACSKNIGVTQYIYTRRWGSASPWYLHSRTSCGLTTNSIQTLVNGFSFYNTRLDIQGVINIFFSIFLFTQIFSTIDQQIIPRLSSGRSLFEARERRSKTYSWTVMLSAYILVELFWQTVAALLIFVTWWYPTGLWRNSDPTLGSSERSGLAFGMIWLVNLWISTFSQAVGVGMDHDETAVQISTLFFWLSLVFCGYVSKPYSSIYFSC
jgi:ATP-binding cassette subfamily G (WHITE) protein 2 (PDR)